MIDAETLCGGVLCVHVPTSRLEGGFLSTGGAVQPLPWPQVESSTQHGGGLGWRVGTGGVRGQVPVVNGGSPLLPADQPPQGTLSWVLS